MTSLPADLTEVASSDARLRRFLSDLPPIDEPDIDRRAGAVTRQSIDGGGPTDLIDLVIRTTDLTSLEATDTPAAIRDLCDRARHPDPVDPDVPPVAAVCVHSDLVGVAAEALQDSTVGVAAVAGGFPHGRVPRSVKLAEVSAAVDAGATEIDVVLDRAALVAERYLDVVEELVEVRGACGTARLKVILETGELPSYDHIRRAAWSALLAGADFIKTSTGKTGRGATPAAALLLFRAVRDLHAWTGEGRGVKVAGGIRTADQAAAYVSLAGAVVGRSWLTPARLRFGASGLLDDLVARRSG